MRQEEGGGREEEWRAGVARVNGVPSQQLSYIKAHFSADR